jgi:F-type H+/Na+-transporting ATPase subunit alpha
MEAFSKFGGDLDAATKNVIDKGSRNVEILKQPQFTPYSVEKQVAIIYLGTNNLVREVPVKNMAAFEDAFIREMELKMPELLADFKKGNLPEEGLAKMTRMAQDLMPQFKN